MKIQAPLRLALIVAASLFIGQRASAQNWTLVWSDEFDGTAVDDTKWSFQIGDGCPDLCGWGNGEEQWYLAENATVEGGVLRITAKEEAVGGRSYTSARMRTAEKASWTYGRIETRAKMPGSVGHWPAIWMLPESNEYGDWAASGEIDILEVFGNDPATVAGTVHFGGESPANTYTGESYTLPSGTFADEFHDFAIEWVPGEIRWYVDGILYHQLNEWYSTADRFPAPFDEPFHLIVNLALGGAGGTIGGDTTFPESLEVDYIRVYQSENTAPSVSLTAPVDGSTIAPGSGVTLSATADDADGAVSRVNFYVGDALLGSDTEAPYEMQIAEAAEGCYALRAEVVDNLGSIMGSGVSTITVGSCVQAPYLMEPVQVPGVVQAEWYDLGGEGVAYMDMDPTNTADGGVRAGEGIEIGYALGSDQGLFLADLQDGEWTEYSVHVSEEGYYDVDLRVRSLDGGAVSVGADAVAVGTDLAVDAGAAFYTLRIPNVELVAGAHIFRVEGAAGLVDLDHITASPSADPPSVVTVVYDDFSDLTGAAWGYFASAAGAVMTEGDNSFMRATFSGSGLGFYGVMWHNRPDDQQAEIPADPWFSMLVRHSGTLTTVDSYALEITVREDLAGDGYTQGTDDSFRLDTAFDTAVFNDEWIGINAPLSSFVDLATGGNGILEGSIDEVVVVVSQVSGPNPSSVVVDLDDIVISSGNLGVGTTSPLPRTSLLDGPFPNPTTGSVQFELDLPASGITSLTVVDLLGREVFAASEQFRPAGHHRVGLDLDRLASGLYFARLEFDGRVETRQIVVNR